MMRGYMAGNEVANIGDDWQVARGFMRCPLCWKSYFESDPVKVTKEEAAALLASGYGKEKPFSMTDTEWTEHIVVTGNKSQFEFLEVCRMAKEKHICLSKN